MGDVYDCVYYTSNESEHREGLFGNAWMFSPIIALIYKAEVFESSI